LDAIWISHFHADHAFGLPALLVRFWEEKRKGVLNILGQKGIESFVRSCLDLAYPKFNQRNAHPLRFTEVEPGEVVRVLDLSWSTAVTDHSQKNLALRVDSGDKSLFYSGDGRPTVDSIALANKVQLVIHEAFQLSAEVPGHGTVGACLEMAKACGTNRLALVHLQRRVRQEQLGEIKKLAASIEDLEVVVPEPGDCVRI
jgi:ribonuclease BN (tRNA processing enzyme)